MSDRRKTKQQLIEELKQLRRKVAQLQAAEEKYRQVEDVLRRQSVEQQVIFDSSPTMIWFKDAHNRILRLNQAAADTMGLRVEEIEGKSVSDLNPGEADSYYQDDLEVINSGTPKTGIIEPLITASNETRWLQTDKIPYRDEDGEIAGVIVFASDITERRRAEEALEEQRAFLGQVIDIDPNFIFVKDRDGRFVFVNQALADAYGATVDALVGKTDADFNPNLEEVEHFRRDDLEVMDSLQEKFVPEEVITDASGNVRWLQTVKRPLVDADGVARRMLGVATDITDRKQAEEALKKAQEDLERRVEERTADLLAANTELEKEIVEREAVQEALRVSEERFALAVRGSQDGIWDWDIQNDSLYWSPRLKELLGYADDEFEVDFEKFDSMLHPDEKEQVAAAIEAHLRDRVAYDVEQRLRTKSGEYRWFRARGQAVWDEDGQPLRMTGSTTDITESKQAQAERERLLADLERRSNQLQTAAEVSHAATAILDPEELTQQVVDLVQGRFGLYYVGLFLVDRTGEWTGQPDNWAVLRAGTGKAGRQMLAAGHKLKIGGESMIGWCVANRQARIALDVGEEAVRFDNPYLPETRSEMALPLIARGQVVGAMSVQSEVEAAFSDEDISVLHTMADQVANAIENAYLFDEQQRTALLLSERINELDCLNDISRKIDEAPPVPEFLTWVTQHVPTATRYPDLCEVAIELEGQVYGNAEAMDLPCQMVQSLRIGEEATGRLYIAYREEREFLDRDSALLGGIAHRVSGYIENRRLFEQTRAALTEVEATHRSYLRGRWQDYIRQREALRREGFLYEQSSTSEPVTAQAINDANPRQTEIERDPGDSQPMAMEDNGDSDGRTELAVPIVLRGQTIGVLGLEDPHGARHWTDEDRAITEAVSRQLALALENSRLLEETQRRAAREQLIGGITSRVRETLDMDTMLKTAIREIGDALGLAQVEVRMRSEKDQPGNGHPPVGRDS